MKIDKYQEYIKESIGHAFSEQILTKIEEICEDSIQDIIDQGLENLNSITIQGNWSDYWDTKIGWYEIISYINDTDYYTPTIEVTTKFTISRNKHINNFDECLKSLMHRLDSIGFIVKKSYDSQYGRATNITNITAVSKIDNIRII